MLKKILITGASGFIGSFLVNEALMQGFEVYAGIRDSSNLRYLKDAGIHFFKTNLADKNIIKKDLEKNGKFDFVIHNAGLTKTCNKNMFEQVNYRFTKNLIEALYETNMVPDKFIMISSLAAYGPGQAKSPNPVKESDLPQPVSLYGKSKLMAEKYIKSLHNFPYLIFRPTGVYGPREKDYFVMYKSIKSGLETYIGTKNQYLSFIYVEDLSKLIFDALKSNIIQKSYFLSDLNSYTALEFNTILKKELNKKTIRIIFPKSLIKIIAYLNEKISCKLFHKIPTLNTEKFKEISQTNWTCDSTPLIRDFGFKPEYNLKKGIEHTIKWYKKEKLL